MSSCALLRESCQKIMQVSSNLLCREACGRHIFTFSFNGAYRKFKSVITSNTKILSLQLKLKKRGSLSFLDIKVSRENKKFVTSFYRKPTFSRVFTNFESFNSKSCGYSLIDT